MDVIFEPPKGRSFVVEVGFFDTVLEIKHKIQKYHSIPVAKQTLLFDRRALSDDTDVAHSGLLHNSRVRLLIAATEPSQNPIRLSVKILIPAAKTPPFWLELDSADATVASLKEKILREADIAVPGNRALAVSWNGAELLQEQRTLAECGVGDGAEVEVSLRPLMVSPKTMMKVMVVTKCGTRKIPVEVSASDCVGELRKELQKMNQKLQFSLPQEGYFFIYKQNVMDDDRSFRWHQVGNGDTIEIFNGSVTGGS